MTTDDGFYEDDESPEDIREMFRQMQEERATGQVINFGTARATIAKLIAQTEEFIGNIGGPYRAVIGIDDEMLEGLRFTLAQIDRMADVLRVGGDDTDGE